MVSDKILLVNMLFTSVYIALLYARKFSDQTLRGILRQVANLCADKIFIHASRTYKEAERTVPLVM